MPSCAPTCGASAGWAGWWCGAGRGGAWRSTRRCGCWWSCATGRASSGRWRRRRGDRDGQEGAAWVLAFVDGRCTMLEGDGRCGLHARLGPEGKPDGCRSFPLVDVLCESELAVGVAVECRCAIDFADGPGLGPA